MAKLKSIAFKVRNKTNDEMHVKAEASVDQQGCFSLTIPEELAETAQGLAKHPEWHGVSVNKAAVHWRVQGVELARLQAFIQAAMTDHMAVEVSEELVIVYVQDSKVACYVDGAGALHPNGEGVAEEGRWFGALHATNRAGQFSVGLGAQVFRKLTYRRQGSLKVDYERPTSDQRDAHPAAEALNRFSGLTLNPSATSGAKEMPYSDAAAVFFTQGLLQLCALAQRMQAFFGTPEQVQAAIDRHQALLNGPGAPALTGPSDG